MASIKCVICNQRKGKRYCTVKVGKICSVCCGHNISEGKFCDSTCVYSSSSKKYKVNKRNLPNLSNDPDLIKNKHNIIMFSATLSARIHEKIKADFYYEDWHILEAVHNVIDQFTSNTNEEEVLLNRVGIIEAIIKDTISAYMIKENLSLEMLIKSLSLFEQDFITYTAKNLGPKAYIQRLAKIIKKQESEEEQSSLIIKP